MNNIRELTIDEINEVSGWSLASLAGIVGVSPKLPTKVAHAGDGVQITDVQGTIFNPVPF
jgi:hypothetical protein